MPNPAPEVKDQSRGLSLVGALADYAATSALASDSAIDAARQGLLAALAHGFEALRDPECAAHIGPLVPGALMPGGARVPGTSLELDPAQAAFCTCLMLCRSSRGTQWEALHTGQATDAIAAILTVADYHARKAAMEGRSPPKVRDLLAAIVKALEIQSVLAAQAGRPQMALQTATIRITRVATTAVVTAQLGGGLAQIATAVSHACVDGPMMIDPEEIGRGDWARADAAARAVRHACQAMAGPRSGYLSARDLETVGLADKLLCAKSPAATSVFGTRVADGLTAARNPQEAMQLRMRLRAAIERYFPVRQAERINALFAAPERLDELAVNELLAALITNGSR
jgi:2-methylcitrate dehydratase